MFGQFGITLLELLAFVIEGSPLVEKGLSIIFDLPLLFLEFGKVLFESLTALFELLALGCDRFALCLQLRRVLLELFAFFLQFCRFGFETLSAFGQFGRPVIELLFDLLPFLFASPQVFGLLVERGLECVEFGTRRVKFTTSCFEFVLLPLMLGALFRQLPFGFLDLTAAFFKRFHAAMDVFDELLLPLSRLELLLFPLSASAFDVSLKFFERLLSLVEALFQLLQFGGGGIEFGAFLQRCLGERLELFLQPLFDFLKPLLFVGEPAVCPLALFVESCSHFLGPRLGSVDIW